MGLYRIKNSCLSLRRKYVGCPGPQLLFQSLWKVCGIFEVFLHEAAQRPPGRLPMSGRCIVSCWKIVICGRPIVGTLRSRLPRKSRQPLRFAQIAVNTCSIWGPNWRDSGAGISFFSHAGAAAIEDANSRTRALRQPQLPPTPRQRLRLLAE
jgi:hypothetical protein